MTQGPAPREGCTVVVADEDKALLAFMVGALRESGCRVYAAHDALAAYELVAQHQVDLVVTNSCVGHVEAITSSTRCVASIPPCQPPHFRGTRAGPSGGDTDPSRRPVLGAAFHGT
jgi:response regulator RpfG family c-di-GMP phosphodiesterase